MKIFNKYKLPVAVFLFTTFLLSVMQLKMVHPILLAERFIKGGGWVEIVCISFYGSFVVHKMRDIKNVPKWRILTWTIFSFVFFSQLIIGLSGFDKFLMTGKLHLPIPIMILSGPIYRGQLSVMTILFLSTILLTGPTWCSQLCYFGAFDGISSRGKTKHGLIKNKMAIKSTILFLVIMITIVLRWFMFPAIFATVLACIFGIGGLAVMIWISRTRGKMYHCILYCPVGTLVNLLKFINPFRIYIDTSCTMCMKCTSHCKYDALNLSDLKNKKPGLTCTLCGDCLAGCRDNSIKYKFLNLKPETARDFYLFLTISIHTCFLALARI
jgi:ferredoxin-type protein NapH